MRVGVLPPLVATTVSPSPFFSPSLPLCALYLFLLGVPLGFEQGEDVIVMPGEIEVVIRVHGGHGGRGGSVCWKGGWKNGNGGGAD
jgi:hypothetical protein